MSRIGVFGAGSIGCYIGGRLAATGVPVHFVGRARLGQVLQRDGLRLTDYRNTRHDIRPEALDFSSAPDCLADADLILVTVKSAATAEAAKTLAPILKPGACVLSLQNGLGNSDCLRKHLPDQNVLAGMVPFNVVNQGNGRFHQGSSGNIEVAAAAGLNPWQQHFTAAGLPLHQQADMRAVLWGKLLLNLNNAINALSGLPLRQQLASRSYRRCLAMSQREALQLLDAAGIRPARLQAVPARFIPWVLETPDALFKRLAQTMLAIDPHARSSMWEDLERGRITEIDWINGEILDLAQKLHRKAPVNARLVELIRAAEAGGRRDWQGPELLADLTRVSKR